jgi:hypothetical protein
MPVPTVTVTAAVLFAGDQIARLHRAELPAPFARR